MHNILTIIFFSVLLLFTASCEEVEEKPQPKVRKEQKAPLPEITLDRIDLWVELTGELGDFIRRFSLENEEVSNRRELMMLVHSSSRTQLAYTGIFDEAGMTSREFWNILKEMKMVRKYMDIKREEELHNKQLDALISAGMEEIELLKKRLKQGEPPADADETIRSMEAKIREFEELKGNVKPESVGISHDMIDLWKRNSGRIEGAISDMWKVKEKREADIFTHF